MDMIIAMSEEAQNILKLRKAGFDTDHIAKEVNASEAHVDFVTEQLRIFAFI